MQGFPSRAATGSRPLSAVCLFFTERGAGRHQQQCRGLAHGVDSNDTFVQSTIASAGVGGGGRCDHPDPKWLVDSD